MEIMKKYIVIFDRNYEIFYNALYILKRGLSK